MADEAEIIYAVTRAGVPLHYADEMELWELASAVGLHRVETRAQHDEREIVEKSQEYWGETQEVRNQKLIGYTERRKARERERRQAARTKVT